MISAHHLSFAYAPHQPGDPPVQVLRGLSLELGAGEALAVMGITGAGKSTLGHVLAGLAPRHTGGTLSGTVKVAGFDLAGGPPAIGSIGLLFQDAATQLFNTSVENEVAWGLEAMGLPSGEIETRVAEALERFDLAAIRHRPPWALSGGQQKRLALAAIWAMRPYVLILDEPLAGLDAEGRAEVLSTVSTLRQAGTAFLVMTLRPETAAQATRIAFLDGGTLSRPATARSALEQEDVLTRAGLLYPPSRWPDLGPVADSQGNAPAVEVQDLHFQYTEGEEVLRGIDLRISQGQFVALVGPNGAGKSTLVRHLNGLLRATRGTVRVLGQATGNRPTGEIARDVGFLFQRPEQQLFASTVREEIAFGLRRLKRSDPEQHVRRALSRFGLEHLAEHPPALLGYGAQRTVTLASLAALEAPIVVLDEPTVGLDGRGMAQLLDWLADLRRANVTILLVTHELDLAARADRIITLDRGRIVADDKTDRARLTDIQCAEAP